MMASPMVLTIAPFFPYRFLQYGKMLSNQMKGLGVADLFAKLRRPLQILKHDCEVVDIDIVAPPQQLSSKTSQNAWYVVALSAVNASRHQANSSTMKVNRRFSDRRG